MSKRKAPSRADRHGRSGGKLVGNAQGEVQHEIPVPPTTDRKTHRCPVCRNVASITIRGNLRKHNDLFGGPCTNKDAGLTAPLEEIPEVVIYPQNPVPRQHRPPNEPSRLDAGSYCLDCGKWIPGERSYCGRCTVKREAERRAR